MRKTLQKGQKIALKVGRKCLLHPVCKNRIPLNERPNKLYCDKTCQRYGRILKKKLKIG